MYKMKGMTLVIYLDNAATTKPCKEAVDAVMNGLEHFGNPSSLHRLGLEAENLVDKQREIIAGAIGAQEKEIFFTSCATESSNTAIFGAYAYQGKRKHRVVTTTVEHPSVAVPINKLEQLGCEVIRLSPDENGQISPKAVLDAVNEDTFLVSMMLVNNETGAVFDVGEAFSMIKKKYPQVLTHCDCVQGFMKLPFTVKKLSADMISLSGHKVYAPKGIGALYVKSGVHIPGLLLGGGQENNFRSGTECVPLICGFGAAVAALCGKVEQNYKNAKALQNYLIEKCSETGGVTVNFASGSPYITSIAVEGLKSEVLLHFLEENGIYVSSGSACSKGKKSSVIKEFRVPEKLSDSVLRISFSNRTTNDDIDALLEAITRAQGRLARMK
ncbi:cysteine desulfurase family protein [Ruminococcus sp. FC2018]|uniref:cysteine desulfurase family protein n=1 Tax=Ruminococcus sp. FC2018 TaxID=1410617 RepID=UPI001FA79044|nr:cysteine desulfurase family protein [Ruminococcus sp. FC2018]